MKVINLYGGPGSGKSTTAADLFRLMKIRGHKAELVTEYAKDLTYLKDWTKLKDQRIVFDEQYRRQMICWDQVDYIITDSPLPLSLVYAQPDLKNDPTFIEQVMYNYNLFDNFNVLLKRTKPYSHYGRKESSNTAIEIDQQIEQLLQQKDIPFCRVRGDEDGAVILYNIIFNNYEIKLV